ncbi:hypothetical protein J2858_004185 [Neorhizobium galegae]|uniref:hypothetical protein n=1 Tax=Rhizobium/Agrobacterium group TaxID=227290 RepID=UPI001AE103C2|nr:hypothetical protein [Neorhizobium galegae]MBP2551244.1 hypothetical protein [Neorhizobium galegae]
MPFSSYDTLETEDLRILRAMLEEVCLQRSIAVDSEEAQTIGRALIDWYLFGIREPDQLKAMLDPLSETAG